MPAEVVQPECPPDERPAGSAGRWLARIAGHRRTALAAGDQALVAGANFLTSLLIARQLSLDAFGTFVLVYAAMLLAGGFQATLVTQPHNVLGAGKSGSAYAGYTTAIAIGQLAMSVCMGLMMLLAAGVAEAVGGPGILLAATAPAIVAWQGHEFTRRVLYTEQRIAAAVAVDVVGYGGQIAGVAVLWRLGAMSGPAAMGVIGAASALAAVVGMWLLRTSLCRSPDWSAIGEHWRYGRWLVASHLMGEWLSANLLLFVAAAVIGPAAAGIVRVADILLGPSRILGQVVSITLPTQLVRARQSGGESAFREHLRTAAVVVTLLLGGYCLTVALLAASLSELVFGQAYRQYASVIGVYAVFGFLAYLATVLVAALCARERTRAVFTGEALSLAATPIGILLIVFSGLHGLVVGLLLGEAMLVLLLWHAYRQTTGTPSSSAPASAREPELPTPMLAPPATAVSVSGVAL